MAERSTVVAVACDGAHRFSKEVRSCVHLLSGLGVTGDAHAGETVKHRSRVAQNPDEPNLRQVHLIHAELIDELAERGFDVSPGGMGENVLTRGLPLLALSRGTRLRLGDTAVVEVTGLRNPCRQLDGYAPGLMKAVLDRAPDGSLIRKAGVMAVVIEGGEVHAGDTIEVVHAPELHLPLEAV